MINILILSAGTRNKVVQYFRKELEVKGQSIRHGLQRAGPGDLWG